MAHIETTPKMVKAVYEKSLKQIAVVKKRVHKPFTLTEKILFSHLTDPENQDLTRGKSFLLLQPDRVAMQDATAQMAILQFMLSGREESAVPATVHCDHLIKGRVGVSQDLPAAMKENAEVYDFLATATSHYNIGFWNPGAGIIHQTVLENYAFPGGLMIGTDSHTPNAGGLGMIASGVGGADAADVMAGLPWEVKSPEIVGVHLTGKMNGWTSGKDVIIKLLQILTVKGGTNRIIEYFGDGCEAISCTGKATITNMGAELGATCSLFPYDQSMARFLSITGRKDLAALAEEYQNLLTADSEVIANPKNFYDLVIDINLDTLEPHITGPHSPDAVTPLSEMKEMLLEKKWPVELSAALIGSCTNSSYEDMDRSSSLIKQAKEAGLKFPVPFYVSPGSNLVKSTIEANGQMEMMTQAGATILANACGPCIGQWERLDIPKGQTNTIINSFNRNFRSRNDGNPETLSFIASPEITTAIGLSGRLDFNPMTDSLPLPNGKSFRFQPPVGEEIPLKGFVYTESGYQEPEGASVAIKVQEVSNRIQILTPFAPRTPEQFQDMELLCKARGKCTTDHISPAGKWLRFRGHLENISENMLLGAQNAFTDQTGLGTNPHNGDKDKSFAEIGRSLKAAGKGWIIIGDENYGEGSSREHAAMCPRFLGGSAVIARSFARIHETNLKKQGILALTFTNPADYERIQEKDILSIEDVKTLAPGKSLTLKLTHFSGKSETVVLTHTYNAEQIQWFWAGSALNLLRQS